MLSQQNVSTVMGTAQAGGIALAAARRDVDVHFHTPSEVKAAVTGNGRAGKAQVTGMVTKILALQAKPTSSGCRRRAGASDLSLSACPDDRPDGGGASGRRAPRYNSAQLAAGEHNLARSAGRRGVPS